MTNPIPQSPIRLGIGAKDAFVHQCDHIAYFWETDQEFSEAVGFLAEGLRNRDHCVLFGYDEANQRVAERLGERGFNVERLVAQNQLSILGAAKDGAATLQSISATFQAALDAGATMIRLLGNIGWNRPQWPGEADIMAFEAKVTSAARAFPCVVICMYDVRALPGNIIVRGGLETHPVTIRGNVVRVNAWYVPPEEFLHRLKGESKRKSEPVAKFKKSKGKKSRFRPKR